MLEVHTTTDWCLAYPGAHIGILEISGLDNPHQSPALEAKKRLVEQRLRARYAGYSRSDFLALPILAAYERYYKRFDKTYHVQLQLESVVLKGKNLPSVSPLVDANFTAELETLVLTAGHDADRLQPPLSIDVSRKGDAFAQMGGTLKELHPGDILMRDLQGIICTILYGQDNISPITTSTRHVLYVVYAPEGVPPAQVEQQFASIERYVRLFSTGCQVEQRCLFNAQGP